MHAVVNYIVDFVNIIRQAQHAGERGKLEEITLVRLRRRFDLVVTGDWLDFGEQLSRFWLKDGNGIIRSGKGPDSVERVKQVQDGEFYLFVSILPQNVSTSIASDLPETRKRRLAQELFVGVRMFSSLLSPSTIWRSSSAFYYCANP